MRIELVCTGDELVTGLTVDTNSAFLEDRLFALGEKVRRVVTIGDVREDIIAALREGASRAEMVIVSGGLGPTSDDFTAECAAEAAGVPLIVNEEVLSAMRERFSRRNLALTENNARQARVPEGAEVVLNPVGSAPMFIVRMGTCELFFLPGVPREFKALIDAELLPRVRARVERQAGRVFRDFRLLRTMGIPESHLDARVAPIARRHPRVVFGFRTQAPENHLKLMAEAPSQVEAEAELRDAEREVREELGAAIFATGDDRFAEVVVALLKDRRERLAVAESCTGGLVAAELTSVSGASEVLAGAAVVYTDALKTEWAGVSPALLAAEGAVSAPVAEALASGIRVRLGTEWGLGVTGFAGPTGGTEADPVGTVYCAVAGPTGTRTERQRFAGDRERVRTFAAAHVLDLLRRRLLEENEGR